MCEECGHTDCVCCCTDGLSNDELLALMTAEGNQEEGVLEEG
jgi:hypothetical protein